MIKLFDLISFLSKNGKLVLRIFLLLILILIFKKLIQLDIFVKFLKIN